jgi:hypothetical protein
VVTYVCGNVNSLYCYLFAAENADSLYFNNASSSRLLWPRGLRRRSAVASLLGSRVRITLRACFSVVYMLSRAGRGL